LALCVSCKGCKRECPTGVDMAAMKIEFLHHYHRHHRRSVRDRLVAHLPRYAPWAARLAPLMNLRDRIPGAAKLSEALLGLAAGRTLPNRIGRRSAGRQERPDARHALCVFAGANSVFYGEKPLTPANPDVEHDRALCARLGLKPMPAKS
jgi:Fe-S oxidoreductase